MKNVIKKIPGDNRTTVGVGVGGGFLSIVIMWIMNTYLLPAGAEPVTPEIAIAFGALITAIMQRVFPA